MSPRSIPDPRRLLVFYYVATVVFLMLDYGFSVNVRVAALEAYPNLRAGYYLVILACLGVMLWRPSWATAIGVVESLATLIALIMNMALRSMIVTDQMLETGIGFVTTAEIVNFVISGSIAWFSWQRGMTALFGKEPHRGSDPDI
jgi:hypothetical protein